MWTNNLKIAFRNLWKNREYSAINIGGLTIAFCCFIFILLYSNYEYSYDRWNKQLSNVYQVDTKIMQSRTQLSSAPPTLPSILTHLPEIAATTRITSWYTHQDKLIQWRNKRFYTNNWMAIDSTFFKVFPYTFTYGNIQNAFTVPNYAILDESFSKKAFPNTDPIGKKITVNDKLDFIVTGVVHHPTTPSNLQFNILISNNKKYLDSLKGTSTNTYLLAQQQLDTAKFNRKLTILYRKAAQNDSSEWWGGPADISLMIEPLQQLHLHSILSDNQGAETVQTFLLLGLLIILLATINYTNLSIVQASQRAKEIAIRKVIGASRKQVAHLFLLETSILVCLSFLLSFMLANGLLTPLNHMLNLKLILWNGYFLKQLVWQSGLIILGVILLSGVYPALVLSGFSPIRILKGSKLPKNKGTIRRHVLLFFQLAVFISFISATLIIYYQTDYIANRDYGLRMDGIIILKNQRSHQTSQLYTIENQIQKLPGVYTVSHASTTLGSITYSFQIQHQGNKKLLRINTVGYNYFKLMGIPIKEGRSFSPSRDHDSSHHIILNQKAANELGITAIESNGIKLGDDYQKTIGIVPNTLNTNPKDSIQSEAYRLQPSAASFNGDILVKLSAGHFNNTISDIKKLWHNFEPDLPLRYKFLDQEFEKYLTHFYRLNTLIALFAAISILIGFMGLLALSLYQIRQRTKEIGIRKVLGASALDVFKMINRSFFRITILANLFSIPLIYILMKKWLNEFAYRINMPIMPFIITLFASLILTLLAVGIQLWKTVKENPASIIKYE